jgi:hypothetical protein
MIERKKNEHGKKLGNTKNIWTSFKEKAEEIEEDKE